jgi:hypothetical protein
MITTLTYDKNGEQLTLILECGPMEELRSQEYKGDASFRKSIENYVSKSHGTYDETVGLARLAAKKFDLQLSVRHEGMPPNPDDLEFD